MPRARHQRIAYRSGIQGTSRRSDALDRCNLHQHDIDCDAVLRASVHRQIAIHHHEGAVVTERFRSSIPIFWLLGVLLTACGGSAATNTPVPVVTATSG